MRKEQTAIVSVKSVFIGNDNLEQVFYELLRKKSVKNFGKSLDFQQNMCYNIGVGFPDLHAH